MKIGTQLHLGGDTPLLEDVRPVKNSNKAAFAKKPARQTGLWTSSWQAETQTSAWSEWSVSNWKDPYEQTWYLLTPREGVKLYVLDSLDDLHILLDRFLWETEWQQKMNCSMEESMEPIATRIFGGPVRTTTRNRYYAYIDFERLATEYDGLWLTEQGNAETHLSYPHDLYGWDTESTLWFRWCFRHVERIATPAKFTGESKQ